MDSRTHLISQTQPAIPTAPPVLSTPSPLDPWVSAYPERSFSDGYTPLDDMLLPEQRLGPLDDTSQTPDAISLSTDGDGPLDQMHLPDEGGLDDQREYVIDHIASTGSTDESEVRYKPHWFGYETKYDTWLP